MRNPLNKIFLFFIIFLISNNVWVLSNAEQNTVALQTKKVTDNLESDKRTDTQDNKEFAGELFGVKVPIQNYYFVKDVIKVFGNRWGKPPKNTEELKDAIWEQLLLSFIAFNQNINVTQDELEEEIAKMLAAEKLSFDWRKDRPAYGKWVKHKANEPVDLFENQLRHLIQLQKLRNLVMDSIKPDVFDKDVLQKFLDQHNTLSLELVEFTNQKDADEFYKKASGRTDFWEKAKKKRFADFKRPGLVSLSLLMDKWKVPREAVYKMMQRDTGEIYPPRPIYKGYAVFKILEKKPADESQFPQAKEPYYVDLIRRKKYDGLNEWLRQLKEQANIKIYYKEGGKT